MADVSTTTTKTSRVDALRASVPSSWRAEHMPPHLRHAESDSLKNRRGQKLSYVALFPPADQGAVRGVVLFLHGINEHCRRYYHLYEQLCEAGFGVVAYDLVSHGQSDSCEHGARAHARRFHYFVDDTNDFLTFVKKELLPRFLDASAPLPPLVLAGMSYGTLVGLHTVLDGAHAVDAIVLTAPAVSVEWTTTLRVQRVFAKPLSLLLPKARIVPGVNRDWLCRDPAFITDFENDPLTVAGDVTARMGEQSLGAMLALEKDTRLTQAESAFCQLPILLLMGSSDKVTSLPLAKEFYDRIANRDKELKIFDGHYHALFDDIEKDAVFDHLIAWLHARFPVGGAGHTIASETVATAKPVEEPVTVTVTDKSDKSDHNETEVVDVVTAKVTTEDGEVYEATVEVAVQNDDAVAQNAATAASATTEETKTTTAAPVAVATPPESAAAPAATAASSEQQ